MDPDPLSSTITLCILVAGVTLYLTAVAAEIAFASIERKYIR